MTHVPARPGPWRAAAAAAALAVALPASAGAAGFPEVAARIERGMVRVEARAGSERRTGTGFLLGRPGMVATALHTVAGATQIRVSLPGRFTASDARLLAASSVWDAAVLAVPWPRDVEFAGLALRAGDDDLPPGTEIAAAGFPSSAKELEGTVLTLRGIVGAGVPHHGGRMYLLDFSVQRGFSGGPVYLPGEGEVAGMITRILEGDENGCGFGSATPASVLRDLSSGQAPRDHLFSPPSRGRK